MTIRTSACPLCDLNSLESIYQRWGQPLSYFLSSHKSIPLTDVEVSLCLKCDFLFQSSAYFRPEYQSLTQKLYEKFTIMDPEIAPFPQKKEKFAPALSFVEDFLNQHPFAKVLEIGSNRGDFLFQLQEAHPKISVLGVESTPLPFTGVPTLFETFKPSLFDSPFDLIILRHVLEHITYPLDFLRKVQSSLKPGGRILIEVPNTQNDLKEKIETFTPDHVNYFTRQTLQKVGDKLGLGAMIKDSPSYPLLMLLGEDESSDSLQQPSVKNIVEEFKASIASMTMEIGDLISQGWKVVFYGTGNLFLWVYFHLQEKISKSLLDQSIPFLIDDSTEKANTTLLPFPIYYSSNLNQYTQPRTLFILCSSNRGFLTQMAENVRKAASGKIFIPWRGLHEY